MIAGRLSTFCSKKSNIYLPHLIWIFIFASLLHTYNCRDMCSRKQVFPFSPKQSIHDFAFKTDGLSLKTPKLRLLFHLGSEGSLKVPGPQLPSRGNSIVSSINLPESQPSSDGLALPCKACPGSAQRDGGGACVYCGRDGKEGLLPRGNIFCLIRYMIISIKKILAIVFFFFFCLGCCPGSHLSGWVCAGDS